MLSADTLTQLSALKKEIRATRDVAQGVVRGTSGRYGFVRLEDERDIYLKPEQMEKVFPGDKVEILITKNDKDQFEGTLEKLIHSPLKQIAGRYCIKGKGHFVIYESQLYSRWIFVPPKERANTKDGTTVTAKVIQHPYNDGKAQAKISHKLSNIDTATNIRRYTMAQHQLFEGFPKEVMDEAKRLQEKTQEDPSRADFRDKQFVTIDAASTRDMDDAVTISPKAEGWDLWVAIADPASEIAAQTALDKTALRRNQTLYFPGKPSPMLPEILATERYSLIANENRLSLVCKLSVSTEGKVESFEFIPAVIQSKAKLSYQQASELIEHGAADSLEEGAVKDLDQIIEQLRELQKCTQALHQYRAQHQLVLSNRPDFYLKLNQEGKLESIDQLRRTPAHQIIEEAMVATNQSAGRFLAENNAGLFTTHKGFKTERREDVEQLLRESLGEEQQIDTQTLASYTQLIRHLQKDEQYKKLMAKQQRFQNSSELSLLPSPHFGLGCEHYATVTSPIRRYQDLYNQRQIHQILAGKSASKINNTQLSKLQEANTNNRSAVRTMQQWLIADYMKDKIGEAFKGYIALLTNQGIGIRLHETGVEGFIVGIKEDKDNPDKAYDKISFNNQRLDLSWNNQALELEQDVEVKLTGIDPITKKLAFSWVETPQG